MQLNIQITGNEQAKVCRWKKFEYYNFPVLADNDQYQLVQMHFFYLKELYIDHNYIEASDKINLQGIMYIGLFVDRQYDLLTDIQGKAMQARDKRIFGDLNQIA